jgi:large conductance mechanosensitive channel
MRILKEFQQFAIKGNVVDMAIGIIIGWAFGKVVSSLVADVIMPPIGAIVGWVDFTGIKILLSWPLLDEAGAVLKEAVYLNIGTFAQHVFDFTIVAFAMFMVIKAMNKLKKKEEKKEEKEKEIELTKEQELLTEIRDLLKETKK